jgi:hypothetical protein
MPDYIRIEPAKHFDKAIHRQRRDGYITYDYWKLVEVCMRLHDESMEDAIEWVEYNILGLNDSVETYFGVHYPEVGLPVKVRRKVRRKVGKRKR